MRISLAFAAVALALQTAHRRERQAKLCESGRASKMEDGRQLQRPTMLLEKWMDDILKLFAGQWQVK